MIPVRVQRLISLVLWGLFAIAHPAVVPPLAGAELSGTSVTISANASDNVGVVGVQFLLDGQPLGAEDTIAPYSMTWDTTTVADGNYSLTAVARDAAGNEGVSPPVTITVNNSGGADATPPTVVTTSPANGATVASVVPVTASASDNVGVVGVQFYVDGAPLGPEDTTSPYSTSWNTGSYPNGTYVVTARARDAAGNQATSATVTVVVNNADRSDPPPLDTTAPHVHTTGPANGSIVSDSVLVTASAEDSVGVAGVQFYLDGVPLGPEDLTAPYAVFWDTRTATNEVHVLSARARDAAGNQATSTGISVTVDNSSGSEPVESSESSESPEEAPASASGTVNLSIEPSTPGFKTIRSRSDAGDKLVLYVDGQRVHISFGSVLEYEWDVRPLLGSHEVRVVVKDSVDNDILTSTSLFHTVTSTRVPSVSLEVAEIPIVGATFIRALADVSGAARLELYIDGELQVTELANELEYAWEPGGDSHQIVFAAYDSAGVVASVTAVYVP